MESPFDLFIVNLTLIKLIQELPGVQGWFSRLPPIWYFRITLWMVVVSSWFTPHVRRRARVFRAVFNDRFSRTELASRTRRYLYHSRLVKDIEIAWINWGHRCDEWITIEGECHLRAALQQGGGAVLLSPHNYGFSKLVAPVFAARGYRIHRGGNGGKKAQYRYLRWGTNGEIDWHYLDYKGDYWHRVQLLKTIQQVLSANDIVHISPRGYSQGAEEMAIEFLGRKFYLDANWFRVLRVCRAPILPCFAVANAEGKIRIVIHPPIQVSGQAGTQEFSKIQAEYITNYPECGRLWKSVYVQKGKW